MSPLTSHEPSKLLSALRSGDIHALARTLTLVENESEGSRELLLLLPSSSDVPIIGLTGPPGAGKSTLINALVSKWVDQGKKVAVLAVDPTSPFNYGSLLGDRLRMMGLFNNESVFIRSVASRGSLGGLSEKVIELTDVLRCGGFDLIVVETVGVGQSEVEIAGLADTTVVLMVPESGDEIQTMKSGIMEIADVFVVNKSDRAGADALVNSLRQLSAHARADGWTVPVVKASATAEQGLDEIMNAFELHRKSAGFNRKKLHLLAEKSYRLIQQRRMRGIRKDLLTSEIEKAIKNKDFNLYRFVEERSDRFSNP